MEAKLEQARTEKRIAQDANDLLCGKNAGTVYADPSLVLACVQGRAERLLRLLRGGNDFADVLVSMSKIYRGNRLTYCSSYNQGLLGTTTPVAWFVRLNDTLARACRLFQGHDPRVIDALLEVGVLAAAAVIELEDAACDVCTRRGNE